MNCAPWAPSPPFWGALPAPLAEAAREDYEERAAIMEFHGKMPKGLAEAASYSFAVADSPLMAEASGLPAEEIERQTFRAAIIRRTLVRFEKAWSDSFVPWVRERDPAARRAAA